MLFQSTFAPLDLPECNLIEFLFQNKYNTPENRPILIDSVSGAFLTYGQLKDSILRFAAGLQDRCGFKRNDVLVLYAPNQYNYSIPLFGTIAAGGATSPANPNYQPHELAYQLEQTKAKILIASADNIDRALAAAAMVGLPKTNIYLLEDKPVQGIQPFTLLMSTRRVALIKYTPEEAKSTIAYLCFSSGTTGRSKGVMTTHYNITSNLLQYMALDRNAFKPDTDRTVAVLPFFHVFALTQILHVLFYMGIPVYVMKRFDLVRYCRLVQEKNITFAYLVPPILLSITKQAEAIQFDLSSLRWITCGAAPLGNDLLEATRKRLPTTIVRQGYGLTETSPVVAIEPLDNTAVGSVGLLCPNMTVKLVTEEGRAVGFGERGEIWIKGPNVMKGYINNPEATAESIDEEGYFHTGDVGVVDKENRLYIVDRLKELIKYKGFQVPPAELESYLLKSPEVADCAVIGVYDPEQATELPIAYVTPMPNVPRNDETKARLMKFIADQVVPYKQIRRVEFIDAIPKSPSGKILRRVLRDRFRNEEQQRKKKTRGSGSMQAKL